MITKNADHACLSYEFLEQPCSTFGHNDKDNNCFLWCSTTRCSIFHDYSSHFGRKELYIHHAHTHTYIYIYYIDTTLIATQGAPMQLMQVLRHLIAFSYVVLVRAFLLAYSGPERPIRPRWVEKSFLQTLPFSCAMSAASQLWRPAEFGKSSSQHPNAKERSNQPHHPKAR